ncbi:hypothetical protein INR49_011355 [Caranx melampygus]|nr:hypothetical protein INR49_011355 [Caranx melampygus]
MSVAGVATEDDVMSEAGKEMVSLQLFACCHIQQLTEDQVLELFACCHLQQLTEDQVLEGWIQWLCFSTVVSNYH